MRFTRLTVRNFRAIRSLELIDLGDSVILAGPNGCGKSCVFDAMRLFKSVYGGYSHDEYHKWFGEFNIDLNNLQRDVPRLLHDKSQPMLVEAVVELSAPEKLYIRTNARNIVERDLWKRVAPHLRDQFRQWGQPPSIAEYRHHEAQVKSAAEPRVRSLIDELDQAHYTGSIRVKPEGGIEARESTVLELIFSMYEPENVGIIDFHGAHRQYGRENVGSINFRVKTKTDAFREHALYQYSNKYSNIKQEMATAYLSELLAREAGAVAEHDTSLTATLRDLFDRFFPGKRFDGPKAQLDGSLDFPVTLTTGAEHDLNELSSGEKEVLFGYLRLRSTAPKNSIILLDEPELHLNPRLIASLPAFYHKYLGKELNNQLWLATHSDSFLRAAVGQHGFSLFHLLPTTVTGPEDNQAKPIAAKHDAERAVIDLVGDLASYRPGGKIVLFEGDSGSQFDLNMTSALFPEVQERINAIASGSRGNVRDLFGLLSRASRDGAIDARVFAVVDRDSAPINLHENLFVWDVYHIENYLLDEVFIAQALGDLRFGKPLQTAEEVRSGLHAAAQATLDDLIRHQLVCWANKEIVPCIEVKIPSTASDLSQSLSDSIRRTSQRVTEKVSELLPTRVSEKEREHRAVLTDALKSGRWRSEFRGRDILRKFSGSIGIKYEDLRNLTIARMRSAGHRPAGMASVIRSILDA